MPDTTWTSPEESLPSPSDTTNYMIVIGIDVLGRHNILSSFFTNYLGDNKWRRLDGTIERHPVTYYKLTPPEILAQKQSNKQLCSSHS